MKKYSGLAKRGQKIKKQLTKYRIKKAPSLLFSIFYIEMNIQFSINELND